MSLWELCYFRWQSKEVFWLNSNLFPLHLYGLIPRCLRSCCVLVQSVAKAASQYLHEKFLSPVCVVLCLSKCGFFLNAWPQMSHTFGFSSEWADLWWLRRRHFSTNCLWQSSHVNSPTSPCFSTWCCLTNIILAYLFPQSWHMWLAGFILWAFLKCFFKSEIPLSSTPHSLHFIKW